MEYFRDSRVVLYHGDCRQMAEIAADSVQCCVTSPPYWGLRKYAGEQEISWQDGTRAAFSLELSLEPYVKHTVEILREVRRVLRNDGVVFWNIGDSYAHDRKWGGETGGKQAYLPEDDRRRCGREKRMSGLKPKDLCLLPFRVALAAQADGWWVRSVIIWNKLNPMPESVRDRPTESHEYILMLTKSANYYWDAEAMKEAATEPPHKCGPNSNANTASMKQGRHENRRYAGFNERYDFANPPNGRNLRSVWTFATQPYKGAHFATFPEALPERCIKVATPEMGCCAECEAPWERILSPSDQYAVKLATTSEQWFQRESSPFAPGKKQDRSTSRTSSYRYHDSCADYKTLGWRPSCSCKTDKPLVPSLVLDPFAGSGTTLWVAKRLGRRAVGYELSEQYCQLTVERNRQAAL